MVAQSIGTALRAVAEWQPRQALAAAWYSLRDWLTPQPEMALLSEELCFITPQDIGPAVAEASRAASAEPALTVLELPMDQVLTQTLQLPERLRRHLDQAIEHNLSQWSPFSADEVLVAHRASQPAGASFNLDLRYVLRSDVQPVIDSLDARGIPLTAVALGERTWLSVIDKTAIGALIRRRQRVRLLSLTAVLLSICLWLVINWRLDAELQHIQQSRFQTIAQLRPIGDEIAQLRKVQDARRFVADQGDRTIGEAVLLLAEMLPPSVAPRALTVERGGLRLVVPSDSAETARASLAGKAGIEKVIIERGPQDQATISAVLISARPQ
jgi:hypothetical protein